MRHISSTIASCSLIHQFIHVPSVSTMSFEYILLGTNVNKGLANIYKSNPRSQVDLLN